MDKKRVVVVGGGTGTHTVLRGLRPYSDQLDITAVVSMSDSGGSTGRLRDEFGRLPIGDIRNALTALAADGDEHDKLLRQLFSYRFDRGQGLAGHNFGNLLLTALTEILGDEVKAIEATSRILRVSGRVVPVTTDNNDLVAEYEDGTIIKGEDDIDRLRTDNAPHRIVRLLQSPVVKITESAKKTLLEADLVVLGPGDLYTSVLANCIVGGFAEALQQSRATVVYVCNLMSKQGQTVGMNAKEHIDEIIKYIGRNIDIAIVNNTSLSQGLLKKYASKGDYPILNNCSNDVAYKVCAESLVADEEIKQVAGDALKRSLIRHDPDKLAAILLQILN
ncbi:MAG: YvcK family protein [Candidatus Nomurabacteria bacterium]|nr:YvcK family protein [Candidatus Nomurabacteria bacterium]USN88138.1 MAG: YvcK family protein [Candidatus Nomurabacteria bacterium]